MGEATVKVPSYMDREWDDPLCLEALEHCPWKTTDHDNGEGSRQVRELPRNENRTLDGNLQKHDRREKCNRCQRRNPIGFHVPDEVWQWVHDLIIKSDHTQPTLGGNPPAVPDRYDILCINCFTEMADWFGVEWDVEIEFAAISRYASTLDALDV